MHTQILSRWDLGAWALFTSLLVLNTPAAAQGLPKDLTVEQRPIAEVEAPQSDLTVSAWVDRGDKTYRLGDTLTLFVKASQDAYISVIDVGTSGKVTVVFPNEYQTDNFVRAYQVVQIPPRDAGFRFRLGGSAGAELLKVIATTRPDPLLTRQPATAAGPFRQLQSHPATIARDLGVEIAATPDYAFATANEIVHILEQSSAATSSRPGIDSAMSPDQMFRMGEKQFIGDDGDPDYAAARTWYQKAAAAGHSAAMAKLGFIYERGLGVGVDQAEARAWYIEAAGMGDTPSMLRLAQIYISGDGVMIDYAQAVEWFRRAAGANDGTAIVGLAWCYDEGIGVEKDMFEAARYLLRAISLGTWEAQEKLPQLSVQTRREVQELLRNAGYYAGPIDGKVGPQTQAALMNYAADSSSTVRDPS